MRTLAAITACVVLGANAAFAHGAGADEPSMAWTFDPWIVLPLAVAGAAYAGGAVRLWHRAGFGRVRLWHGMAYAAGWLSLVAALVSPLHWLGERLFTAHMIEHEIVMAVAAPLLVLARPLGPMLWALPLAARRRIGRLVRQPWLQTVWRSLSSGRNATLLHGMAIWAWHAPALFDAAVTDVAMHRLQHLSFFLTGVLFWWSVIRRSDPGAAAWHLFVTMLHTSALGALMALAPRVLYGEQTLHSAEWGLSPLADQQLAGVVMWVPAGTVYAGAALALTALWIHQSGKSPVQTDARPTP